MVRDVPFRAIQLTSYELLKNLLRTWRKKSLAPKKQDDNAPEFSAGDSALLGGIAGAISATCTCPLDVIRTRLMVGAQEGVSAVAGGAGTWAGAIKEGGLFAGVGTRIFYVGVSSAIFFVVYESAKQQLLKRATLAGLGGGGSVKSDRAPR